MKRLFLAPVFTSVFVVLAYGQNVMLSNFGNAGGRFAPTNGRVYMWDGSLFDGYNSNLGVTVFGGPSPDNLSPLGTFAAATGYDTGIDLGTFWLDGPVNVPGVAPGGKAVLRLQIWYDGPKGFSPGLFSSFAAAYFGGGWTADVLFQNPTENPPLIPPPLLEAMPSARFGELYRPPMIATQPVSRANLVGTAATFTVKAVMDARPLNYQWRFNGAALAEGGNISGAATSSLTIWNVQPTNAGNYSVVVFAGGDSAFSEVAVLTILAPPAITSQPLSRTNFVGATATFAVAAIGDTPLNYQWRFNGTNLANGAKVSGATSTNLTLAQIQTNDAGGYSAVMSNPYGSATSAVAMLTVKLPPELQITCSGPQVVLSWLTNGPGFVVETCSNLSAPVGWLVVTNDASVSGNRFWVTNPPSSNPAFYRLRQTILPAPAPE